jgi:hypothetical protein
MTWRNCCSSCRRLPILYVKTEGRSVADAAKRTGMSESAVKVGIHRGVDTGCQRWVRETDAADKRPERTRCAFALELKGYLLASATVCAAGYFIFSADSGMTVLRLLQEFDRARNRVARAGHQ